MTVLFVCLAIIVFIPAVLAVMSVIIAKGVEKSFPPNGKFIDIDGAKIHYLDEGQGQAIVMVHGLAGQTGNFSYALLSRLAKNFRVIIIDRPGSGYSTRPAGMPARITAQSEVVAKFIKKLGLDRPLLVGHSMGGAVSLGVALNHPECVGGLALIAPLTHPMTVVPKSFRAINISSALMRRLIAWTLAVPMTMVRGKKTIKLIFGPERMPRDFATAGRGVLSLRPQSFYGASTDLNAASEDLPSMEARYTSLNLPINILYGKQDQVLDWGVHGAAMKKKLPALELETVTGGHMLPVTMPDHVATWIATAAMRIVPAHDAAGLARRAS
ncbi:MAG TPA: alpha/beta hydrolase [Burkholderiaceae bacterium]|nr:alpha/beta hydrolase [Burkholderiaceae bacterium]